MNTSKKIVLVIVCFVVFFVTIECYGAEEPNGFSNAEITKKLSQLKPLPKVHYSWKIENGSLLDEKNDRLLYEYTRITHALSICGESVTEKQIDKCVYTCARINKTEPDIPCSIGVNYSPWHRRFGKDLPPTDRGPTYQAELDVFNERLSLIRGWVRAANQKYDSSVAVSAILLDSERFYTRPGDEKWNDAIREALDDIHIIAQKLFPDARIYWYGRHSLLRGVFTGKEIKAPLSCSFYRIAEPNAARETFVKTCQLADRLGIDEVTPWVALASGYRRDIIKKLKWDDNWDFDPNLSYKLGAELNGRNSVFQRAKVVAFFPAPFYSKTPAWEKHFIAYVTGASENLKTK